MKRALLAIAFGTFLSTLPAVPAMAQPFQPTLDDPADPAAILEDAGPQTVNLTGITDGGDGGQTLAVSATSDNLSLIPDPTVTYASPDTTGSLDYTPVADASGSAVITVTVTDPDGSAVQTFTVSVTAVDDAPVAVDDTATVTEDDPATAIDVLTNDTDIDGGPKTIASASDPAGGTVAVAGDGLSLTYQPEPDFCNDGAPTDDFTYTLSPGGDTGNVAVTVTCVDDAPVAVDDTATVTEDDPATAIDVLTNDTDIDGGPKTIASASDPAGGTVVVAGDGLSLTYQPDPDFCNDGAPTDDFTYTLSPGGDTGNVAVTVTCVDDAPVAVDDTATVTEDDPATAIDVLTNDTDIDGGPKTIASASDPAGGTVAVAGDGLSLTYQPDPDFCNDGAPTDDFTYTLSPGGDTGNVAVTVTCIDDAPVAVDDTATVTEDDPATAIDVLTNDTDIDGGPKTIASASDPAGGTVAVAGDGLSLTYQPDPDFCNDGAPTDDFTYTLSPGGDTGNVAVTVTCVDDAPVAVDDTATVTEDDPATAIDVLTNDTDIDGGPKTIASASDPAGGTVAVAGDGLSLTYQPDPDFCNDGAPTDDFTYTLSPGGDTGNVAVTVTCVNDEPSFTPGGVTCDPTPPTGTCVYSETGTGEQTVPYASQVSVGPANESSQTPAFVVTAVGNPGMFLTAPTVDPDGTLRFTPVDLIEDFSSISVKLTDDGGTANGGDDETDVVTFNLVLLKAVQPAAVPQTVQTDGGSPLTITLEGTDPNDPAQTPLAFQVIEPDPLLKLCAIDGNSCDNDDDCVGGGTEPGAGDVCLPDPGSGPFRGTLDTTTPAHNPGGLTADVTYTPDGPAVSDAVIIATESLVIEKFGDILGGDAVVNDAGGTADIERSTSTPMGYAVKADVLNVSPLAAINGQAFCNGGTYVLQCDGTLDLPVYDVLPPFRVGDVDDDNDVNVPFKGSASVSPDFYGDVFVDRSATLTFAPGKYSMRSLSVDNKSVLQFSGPTEVKIAERLELASNVTVNADGPAAELIFYVNGGDTPAGDAAAVIGFNNANFKANVYAPNGTISIGQDSAAVGAFLARSVVIGNKATVDLDSGFSEAPDQFEFEVTNTLGLLSDRALVEINPVDACLDAGGAPVAIAAFDQEVATNGAASVQVFLSACDGNDVLTYSLPTTTTAHGTLSGLNPATGEVTYTPSSPALNERDSFAFEVTNGITTVGGTVEINRPSCAVFEVTPVDDLSVFGGVPRTLTLSACDPNDQPAGFTVTQPVCTLSTCSVSPPVAAVDNRPGFTSVAVTVSHNELFDQTTSFDFTATENNGVGPAFDTQTVALTIVPDNLPPVAVDDGPLTVAQLGTTGTINLLANDSDPNLDPLTLTTTPVIGPTFGTVSLAPNGNFTYTHTNASGTSDSVRYEVCDDEGACSEATVAINILPPTISLTVNVVPASSGVIRSSPGGVNCGTSCTTAITSATIQLFVAAETTGFDFDFWSGDCNSNGDVLLAGGAARSCTANFKAEPGSTPSSVNVTIQKAGSGDGKVTSEPAGVGCGLGACFTPQTFSVANTVEKPRVILSPEAASGSVFAGFSPGPGCPSTSLDCGCGANRGFLGGDLPASCTVTFTATAATLTINFAGSGTVAGTGGLFCTGAPCSRSYPIGTVVTVSGASDTRQAPVWSGACVPDSTFQQKATVVMNGNRSCTVIFP